MAVSLQYVACSLTACVCTGGDAFSTICLWQGGFAHSDPGPTFSDPNRRLFDPLAGDGPRLLAALKNAAGGIEDDVPPVRRSLNL